MKKETKSKIFKITLIMVIFFLIALAVFMPLKLSGALDKISNAEDFKQIINDGGIYSYLIFFLVQFLQATFLPIPAMVTTITGTLIFGPFISFLISFIAIMLASFLMFFLGKKVVKNFVIWAIGKDDFEKWSNVLSKGKYTFFLMMLFPLFPDDILCLLAGATMMMSYKFFIVTNLITRPIGILATCYLASGRLIPFSGWGIPVWTVLAILGITSLVLSLKYQNKIEQFINQISSKMNKKQSTKHSKSSKNQTSKTAIVEANTISLESKPEAVATKIESN